MNMFGIPFEFVAFAMTLLGVALFHKRTLSVALTGLAVIVAYKLIASNFHGAEGLAGLAKHVGAEASPLANLGLLLLGFAVLARYFEQSCVPDLTPDILPNDWKGGFALLGL